MLEKSEGAIKKGQSRETGNIGYTRRRKQKHNTIQPITGLCNATKTLEFASYFCKMRIKILYCSPDGESIFLEHFHSITDRIFHFKIWFSGLLNRTIDADIKVLNHVLLTLASDHDKQKSKTSIQNFLLKIKRLN